MSESDTGDEIQMDPALQRRFNIQEKFLTTMGLLYSMALHYDNPEIDNHDLVEQSKIWAHKIFGLYSKHYNHYLARLTTIGNFHSEACQHLAETFPRELLAVGDRTAFEVCYIILADIVFLLFFVFFRRVSLRFCV